MTHGSVKWRSEQKGCGFIEQEKGRDVSVLCSDIAGVGFKTLAEGDRVTFDVEQNHRRLMAKTVKKV